MSPAGDDETAVARLRQEPDAWQGAHHEVDLWQLLAAADRALAHLDRLSHRIAGRKRRT